MQLSWDVIARHIVPRALDAQWEYNDLDFECTAFALARLACKYIVPSQFASHGSAKTTDRTELILAHIAAHVCMRLLERGRILYPLMRTDPEPPSYVIIDADSCIMDGQIDDAFKAMYTTYFARLVECATRIRGPTAITHVNLGCFPDSDGEDSQYGTTHDFIAQLIAANHSRLVNLRSLFTHTPSALIPECNDAQRWPRTLVDTNVITKIKLHPEVDAVNLCAALPPYKHDYTIYSIDNDKLAPFSFSATTFKHLSPHVRTLNLDEAVFAAEIHANDGAHSRTPSIFPKYLEMLVLIEHRRNTTCKPLFHLPSTLTHLDITFKSSTITNSILIELLHTLPRTMNVLKMEFIALCRCTLTADIMHAVPRTVKELSWIWTNFHSGIVLNLECIIAALPAHLSYLYLCTHGEVAYAQTAPLQFPSSLTDVTLCLKSILIQDNIWAWIATTPHLVRLWYLVPYLVENEAALHFPATLTTLELETIRKEESPELAALLISRLPCTLTKLHLRANGYIETVTGAMFAHLPRTLRHLKISKTYRLQEVEDVHIADLPRGLIELELDAFAERIQLSQACMQHVPRALRSLRMSIAKWNEDCIPYLPRTLTRFYDAHEYFASRPTCWPLLPRGLAQYVCARAAVECTKG